MNSVYMILHIPIWWESLGTPERNFWKLLLFQIILKKIHDYNTYNWHLNFWFPLLWTFPICLFRVSEQKNNLPHWSHFSSLIFSCRLIWVLRRNLLLYSFPQRSHLWIWSLLPSWIVLMCFFTYVLSIFSWQMGHSAFSLGCFIALFLFSDWDFCSCLLSTCFLNIAGCLKDLSL